jgi:hypothetical protein
MRLGQYATGTIGSCSLDKEVRLPADCAAYQSGFDRTCGTGEETAQDQDSKGEKKRGRPKKGEERPAQEPTRIERQVDLPFPEAFSELPTVCDFGVKHDTDGNVFRWRGYKAHLAWADGMIPLLCVTTSASLHDSQCAIPMMKHLAVSVTSLYDLMDSAYDAPGIRQVSASLGHVALIDQNPRRGEKITFAPAEESRYRERSNAERGNSRLKDSFGLRAIYVRGHAKVDLHIHLGVLALFAHQMLKPFGRQTDS